MTAMYASCIQDPSFVELVSIPILVALLLGRDFLLFLIMLQMEIRYLLPD